QTCVLSTLIQPQLEKLDAEIFFFFQAEDGIRDLIVTGVQTCALPIFERDRQRRLSALEQEPEPLVGLLRRPEPGELPHRPQLTRSEERRVGKECRSRWWGDL